MAEIYLARERSVAGVSRTVAIKCLLPHLCSEPDTVKGFLDEARLLASLHHQNVIQVFEVGLHHGVHFFVMEFVDGENLHTILQATRARGGSIDLSIACMITIQVADGLRHAHQMTSEDGVPMNVVHRDVTPANIVVSREGGLKLLDFGIAKSSRSSAQTETGLVKGTVCYMSPEQCLGAALDQRSDVFSLGVVLYELTTMVQPFGESREPPHMTMERIICGRYKRPTERHNGYPVELEAIVMKAMATSPDERFATTREFLLAVERFALRHELSLSSPRLADFMLTLFDKASRPQDRKRTIRDAPMPTKSTTRCVRRSANVSACLAHDELLVALAPEGLPTVSLLPATTIYHVAEEPTFVDDGGTMKDQHSIAPPPRQERQHRSGQLLARSTAWMLTGFAGLALYGVFMA